MMTWAMASPISGSICCQPLLIRCEETDPAIDLLRPSSAEGIKTTPLFLRHAVTTWKGGSVGSALKGPAHGHGFYLSMISKILRGFKGEITLETKKQKASLLAR